MLLNYETRETIIERDCVRKIFNKISLSHVQVFSGYPLTLKDSLSLSFPPVPSALRHVRCKAGTEILGSRVLPVIAITKSLRAVNS